MYARNVNIRFDQQKWLRTSGINFSEFIREKLDEKIEETKVQPVGVEL